MRRFKWLVFGILALFFVWRIVAVNVSQYLDAERNVAAIQWKRDTPHTLLAKAAAMAQIDSVQARQLALEAALLNPVNGRTYLLLAVLWEREGKQLLAQKAADMADFLAPRDAEIQLSLGTLWAQRGQPIQALAHWGVAIESRSALSKELFPVMLGIAETPQLRLNVAQALKSVPGWWGDFFMYALNNAAHEETLKAIYNERKDKVLHRERHAYLDHLIGAALYTDAYFVWLNGLQPGQISALGNLYDGGFELPIDDEGFGWRPVIGDGFMLAAEPTYGNTGKNALHVAFQGAVLPRHLMQQFLMLDTGQYLLGGKVRLDGLSVGKGLQWVVSCVDAKGQMQLVKSEHFTGTDVWKVFEVPFSVPASQCQIQTMRLQTDAEPGEEQSAVSGSIWFDDLEIKKIDRTIQ